MEKRLTKDKMAKYNKGKPVRCECGWIVAYERDGVLYLYCKKCKRQIPYVRARA